MKKSEYKFFAGFENSPYSLEERGIETDDFTKSLGLLIIAFSDLENELEILIHKLIGIDTEIGTILTAELSYRNKVTLIASLMKKKRNSINENIDPEFIDEFIEEFIKMLFKCEELRNQLTHSFYLDNNNNGAIRIKVSAKSSGYKRIEEKIETSFILDVYDFIVSSKMYVEDIIVNK